MTHIRQENRKKELSKNTIVLNTLVTVKIGVYYQT